MAAQKNPYRLHHQLIQHHFGCRRKDYTATKTQDRLGLGVVVNQQSYRVESWTERLQLCAEELSNLYAAFAVPVELAVQLLDGQETRPGFLDMVTEVLEKSGPRPAKRTPKESFALIGAFQKGLGMPLWIGMERFDRELLPASLVALNRLEGGDVIATRLVELYFANGHVLAAGPDALVLRATVEETELLLYED